MNDEVICNRFEQILGEWVCIHWEDQFFPNHDPSKPIIKLCGQTLRIRANDSWTKLPHHLKEAMTAHEIGHRELNHASIPQDNPFYRLGFIHRGTVDPKETQADHFACKLIGRSKYVQVLRELSAMTDNRCAVLEFQYRIKALELLN